MIVFRLSLILAVALLLTSGELGAQSSGESVYKAKCASCHGLDGMAATLAGKALKVKPVMDSSVKSQPMSKMVESVASGEGKMQPFKGKLTEKEIHDSVAHFRSLMK